MSTWTRHHALFSGCATDGDGRSARRATIALARKLNLALWEAPGDGCCGARHDRSVDVPHRQQTIAPLTEGERQGLAILCLSPACCRVVAHTLATTPVVAAGTDRPVRDVLGLLTTPEGAVALAQALVTSLTPLRVALHGVCHADHQPPQALAEPEPAPVSGITTPATGTALGDLIALTGAEYLADVSTIGRCATVPLLPDIAGPDHSEPIAVPCLEIAAQAGADVLVTACFLCFLGLNSYQRGLAAGHPARGVPVVHLAQLLGLACDVAATHLDLDRTAVSAQRVLAPFV